MGTVTLRLAGSEDIPRLEAWDGQPHVIAATGDDDVFDWADELSRDAAWTRTLIAEEGGRPVGVLQVIDPREEETHYWGEVEPHLRAIDIWIGEPGDLGRGLGTEMMTLVLDECFAEPDVVAVIIDPLETNVRARTFYRRLGFVEVGPRVFGGDHCMVHRLGRDDWMAHREQERLGS